MLLKWSIYGILLGLVFPIFVIIFGIFAYNESIKTITNNYYFWIISSAPVIIGAIFLSIGKIINNIKAQNKDLHDRLLNQVLNLNSEITSIMKDVNHYTNELDLILNNMNSGLCLIDKDYKIDPSYNKHFIEMFGESDYTNNSIMDTVFKDLNSNLKQEIFEFFDLAFNNITASINILDDANPIKEFPYIYKDNLSMIPKTIKSKIIPIKDKDQVLKLMLIFEDVSEQRELEKEIHKKEKEFKIEYSIMRALLRNDKDVIRNFMNTVENTYNHIVSTIKSLKLNEVNEETINDLLGVVHSLKGESFSLGFSDFAESIRDLETYLKEIKLSNIDLEKNLNLLGYIEKINFSKGRIDKLFGQMKNLFEKETKQETGGDYTSISTLKKELQLIGEASSTELGKKILLKVESNVDTIDSKKYSLVKESLLHMIRNSIAHGIEDPETRTKAGKSETGNIKISITQDGDNYKIIYRDDGKGLDIPKITKKALEMGLISEKDINEMNDEEKAELIFQPGFSTNDDGDMVSGTGIGMNVIKKNIEEKLKGKMYINNNPNRGIEFIIAFPK